MGPGRKWLLTKTNQDKWSCLQVGNDPVCNSGTAQSPIDILTDYVETDTDDVGEIQGTLFDEDIEGYLANTGRLVQFVYLGFLRPTIEGGPLQDKK